MDIILSVLVFAVLLCAFAYGFDRASERNDKEQLSMTQQSVERAVINCYAVEGVYPPNIRYLQDHYGVTIDTDKYAVNYQVMGSNVRPYVQVVLKGHEE